MVRGLSDRLLGDVDCLNGVVRRVGFGLLQFQVLIPLRRTEEESFVLLPPPLNFSLENLPLFIFQPQKIKIKATSLPKP